MIKYKRILLKASGQALGGGDRGHGLYAPAIASLAREIAELKNLGVQVGIVVGGGNIFRGGEAEEGGFTIARVEGDYMGMLATVINGIALKNALIHTQVPAHVFSAIRIDPGVEYFNRARAVDVLEKGEVVIFTAGTGNPFFTTDSAAALKAAEIEADILIKATRVDGVYTDNPEKNPKAKLYDFVSYDEVLSKNLKVMDGAAIALCRTARIPIAVLNMNIKGNLAALIQGHKVGTIVAESEP